MAHPTMGLFLCVFENAYSNDYLFLRNEKRLSGPCCSDAVRPFLQRKCNEKKYVAFATHLSHDNTENYV